MAMPSLQHPLHEHALIWRELKEGCNVMCSLCMFQFTGPMYCCPGCKFFLHESCALMELQIQIRHPAHQPHLLKLDTTSAKTVYCCRKCGFDLNVMTAITTLPCVEQGNEKGGVIQHPGHKHPLNSFNTKTSLHETCRMCEQSITPGTFYGCGSGCMFFLHKHCVEQPKEILQHPFHPDHPLTLVDFKRKFRCKACLCVPSSGFGYWCNECKIGFDIICGGTCEPLPHQGETEHFPHHHRLTSFNQKTTNANIQCAVCTGCISGIVHACTACRFFIHKSCADDLPQEFLHHLHPEHPLILRTLSRCDDERQSFDCSVCSEGDFNIMFCCDACRFGLDLACALPTISGFKEGIAPEIQHSSHSHPLVLQFFHMGAGLVCNACSEIAKGLCYSCTICDFNLHKSCAELPENLQHPLHPSHLLVLDKSPKMKAVTCSLCSKRSEGFCFHCTECLFYLDVRCATEKPTFKHPRHEHWLTPIETRRADNLLCNSCGKNYDEDNGREFYRCMSCRFHLHDYCLVDLPKSIIKTECHPRDPVHPLFLFDKFVDGRPDDQYCDYCELIRDPDHGVYRCEECWYTAHIECVIPEVKLHDNPAVIELDKKITTLKGKIRVAERNVEVLVAELDALEDKRKNKLA